MAVVSVDAGTTMIKAVGYQDGGVETTVVRQQTALSRREPGWVEQDMAEVWHAVVHTVRLVVEELTEPIEYLALTAQGDGCWLVDAAGRPTGPAILWNDGRAGEIVRRWRESGLLDEAFRTNGSMGFAGLPHAILTWLRSNDPARLDRSATALTCGGWLFYQLTGQRGVDTSDGATPFMDLRTGDYSPALISLFGLDWARPLLPELRDGERRVAGLSASAAGQLGLPADTPVVLSSYDIASTAIGAGAVEPGQACGILGTTLCTELVTDATELASRASEDVPAGLTVPLGLPGRLLRALPTLAGGEVIQWTCAMLGLDSPAQVAELARTVDVGAGGLSFLPYLSPAGERAPFLDEHARGSFQGLSFEHTRAHVARAVLEGLTLVVADCLSVGSGLGAPTELRVCGGGAASSVWCQLIADVTGLATLRTVDREIGARGAMVVGALHIGADPDASAAVHRYVSIRDSFTPDARRHDQYRELYQDFLALREVAMRGWPRLAQLRQRDPAITATGPIPSVTPSALARVEGLDAESGEQTITRRRQ